MIGTHANYSRGAASIRIVSARSDSPDKIAAINFVMDKRDVLASFSRFITQLLLLRVLLICVLSIR